MIMKKFLALIIVIIGGLAFVACGGSSDDEYVEIERVLCPDCGLHYTDQGLRLESPPMNIHEIFAVWHGDDVGFDYEKHVADVDRFVRGFDNVHRAEHVQFDTIFHRYMTMILWPDVPLRDFRFVALDTDAHEWGEDMELIIPTMGTIFSTPELLPTDAVVLNVLFEADELPRGAVIFTDEDGVRWRIFLWEDTRGGCHAFYHLGNARVY